MDQPLARSGKYFTPNQLGSTTTLTNSSGTVVQSYSYGPFGETTGSGSENNPFQYAGRENDGSSLYYNRARYYRPEWGRFISEDPLGIAGALNQHAGGAHAPFHLARRSTGQARVASGLNLRNPLGLGVGLNQYSYSENNPINALDPSGEWPTWNEIKTYFNALKLTIVVGWHVLTARPEPDLPKPRPIVRDEGVGRRGPYDPDEHRGGDEGNGHHPERDPNKNYGPFPSDGGGGNGGPLHIVPTPPLGPVTWPYPVTFPRIPVPIFGL